MTLALCLVLVLSLGVTLLLHACTRALLKHRAEPLLHQPPVTILKPLKGVDDDLERNLKSFAELEYPHFQLVLGAEDPADPALDVARRIRRHYPDVDISVVAGARAFGRNPKVTNLASMSEVAAHNLWLVSDSNVRVRPSYLRDTVAGFRPGIGLVTNLFAGVREDTIGAALENLQLSTRVASSIAGTQMLTKRPRVAGKSMLFPRSVLERIGGWEAFADILAEDHAIGNAIENLGLETVTCSHVIYTVNSSWSFGRFLNRHLRWSQARRRQCPGTYVAEPLLNPVVWAVAAAFAGAPGVGLAAVLVKVGSDVALARAVRGEWLAPSQIWLLPVKDLLIFGLWLVGAFRRRVWWRGNALWIGSGARLLAEPERRRRHPARATA